MVNEEILKEYVTETIKKDQYSSIETITIKKKDNNNYDVKISYTPNENKIEYLGTIISLSNYSINNLLETKSEYNKYIKDITFSINSPENGYYLIYSDFKNMTEIDDTDDIGANLTIENQNHKKVEVDLKAERLKQKEEYKKQCETYDYKTISHYPDEYKGKKAKFTGKVMQVINSSSDKITYYRINVTKKEYQYIDYESWDDTIYVTYFIFSHNKDLDARILEDDIVNVYGELDGLESYESVSGQTITIPAFDAEYIELAQ